MDAAVLPDFSVHVSRRRWTCVLDPAVALATAHGSALVRSLGTMADLYMVPSFFRALDSSEYYCAHPAALARGEPEDTVRRELLAWERIRARTDLTGLRFYWIGDNQSESRLPAGAAADVVRRYEMLCDALQRCPPAKVRLVHPVADLPLVAAAEVAALACALEPALVLTVADRDGQAPVLCRELAALGLESQPVNADGEPALAALERDEVRRLLVHAGATPLFCAGLRLAVVHVIAPEAALARTLLDELHAGADRALAPVEIVDVDEGDDVAPGAPAGDWWAGARVYWYPVAGGATFTSARAADA